MLKIIKFPDPVLRHQAEEFDFENCLLDPVKLEKDLIETMLAHDGIGLAATQVGIPVRVFVMGWKGAPEEAQAFFNPMVVATVNEVEDLEEGCLSFPGIYVNIKRPKKILARWQTSNGEWQEAEFEGYNCKCFLHELDHLEGIVFQDRVSPLKWGLAVKKSKKGNKINVRTR
jgi:peptide deformylase